ncbi:MAG: Nif3-like dinuclear metal center hexameric protein [Clostridia bacterium]|nr:Nif3-like dinuclear metal center hexameric protein [Clostridia bacterium]
MIIQDILMFLEELAPLTLQESYDNSGLIIGSRENKVSRVLVCLDADSEALDNAIEKRCELVLSHHPSVFRAVKCFTEETQEGRLLAKAIRNQVSFISAHTNFDSAVGGLTDLLCDRLGLKNSRVLMKLSESSLEGHGLGRYGDLEQPLSAETFLNLLKERLNVPAMRTVGQLPQKITRVAVYNGSYDRAILGALRRVRPNVLVTGDLKYHDAQELNINGIFTVDAGHHGTEKLFVDEMIKLLYKRFPDLETIAFESQDIFKFCDATYPSHGV